MAIRDSISPEGVTGERGHRDQTGCTGVTGPDDRELGRAGGYPAISAAANHFASQAIVIESRLRRGDSATFSNEEFLHAVRGVNQYISQLLKEMPTMRRDIGAIGTPSHVYGPLDLEHMTTRDLEAQIRGTEWPKIDVVDKTAPDVVDKTEPCETDESEDKVSLHKLLAAVLPQALAETAGLIEHLEDALSCVSTGPYHPTDPGYEAGVPVAVSPYVDFAHGLLVMIMIQNNKLRELLDRLQL